MEAVFKGMNQSTLQIDNQQITILIVDDNEANLLLLDTVLKTDQYQVVQAKDGLEALVKVKESKPDLILLDIMMPNLDGYECCNQLKDDPDTSDIPIIFLSAKSKREDIIQGLELGAGYGFQDITDIGAKIETAAVAQNVEEIKSLIGEFKAYLENVEPQYD